MPDKIKIAFIKFGGLAAGGTEKYLQQIAANLPKERFEIDYFYCDAAPYIGSDYKHGDTDPLRVKYMQDAGVNLIKFNVKYKDVTTPTHDWVNTDFWQKFDETKYDLVQAARSGHPEYPFTKIKKTPIIDSIHLPGMVDNQENIAKVIHISETNKRTWVNSGGDEKRTEVVYLPIEPLEVPKDDNFRKKFNIENKFVVGLHQRSDENIFSPLPLSAFSELPGDDNVFILLGGSSKHAEQAKDLKIKNFIHIPFTSDMKDVYRFLNTLDVYLHGRRDGEVNSQAIAEALSVGMPIVSHVGFVTNGHVETIGNAGYVHGHYDSYLFDVINYKENKGLRLWIAEKARNRFTQMYSFPIIMNKIVSIYEEVVLSKKDKDEPWLKDWLSD